MRNIIVVNSHKTTLERYLYKTTVSQNASGATASDVPIFLSYNVGRREVLRAKMTHSHSPHFVLLAFFYHGVFYLTITKLSKNMFFLYLYIYCRYI